MSHSHRDHEGTVDPPKIELSDEDILDAMRHIPGYLDITTEDFRLIYHRALGHAMQRLFRCVRADRLMRTGIEPLQPDLPLDQAAAVIAKQRLKSLPVVDEDGKVIGMLTETDFLRHLQCESFLEVLLRLVRDVNSFRHRWHELTVRDAMTPDVISIGPEQGFDDILRAFRQQPGRSMPVVDAGGRLMGLLLRKDFIHASDLEGLL